MAISALGSMGSWAGTMLRPYSTGTGASKVTNEAMVYNNKGTRAGRVSFADLGNTPSQRRTQALLRRTPHFKGYVTVVTACTVDSGRLAARSVMADAFTHSGIQNHTCNGVPLIRQVRLPEALMMVRRA